MGGGGGGGGGGLEGVVRYYKTNMPSTMTSLWGC